MKLTVAQKDINIHIEEMAINCSQKAKECQNMILGMKTSIKEYEQAEECWMLTAAHMRGLKYKEAKND